MLFLLFIVLELFDPGDAAVKLLSFEVRSEMMHLNTSVVCYNEVGCFSTDAPFFYLPDRPVPPPEDPIHLKGYLRFFDRNESESYHEILLSGKTDFGHSSFDAQRELTVFILGCYDDYEPSWKYDMKDAILSKVDANVFVFDTLVKRRSILQNISNLRVLSYQLARFIKHLQTEHGLIPEEKVWVIGFGCGAHMAGYCGRRVIINRITGLDPSNFLFENSHDIKVHLSRSDGLFVDVHHTDASHYMTKRGTGYVQPLGHIDFYYNGGFEQPGCPKNKVIPMTAFHENYYNCDHDRAHIYFRQAILLQNDNLFIWGRNITVQNYIHSQSDDGKDGVRLIIAGLQRDQCDPIKCVPVGLDTSKTSQRGIKVVTTMPYEPWYNTVDQSDRERFRVLFIDEVIVRWLHSMVPESKYTEAPVPILPQVKPACYQSVYPWPLSWTLGCFNQSEPWFSMKSRPISNPNPPSFQRIEAWFFTRKNINESHNLSLYPRMPFKISDLPFDPQKMTFVIIHGFYNSANEPWIAPFKNALLKTTDSNVIVANWGNGSVTLDYLQAAGNLRMAARIYSNMIQHLVDHKGMNVTKLHLIGHSLGAHIAGLIGKSIPGVFQITALDPAQPWFEASDPLVGVTKDDASFVVGVHSDAPPFLPDLGFGLAREVGHVDFYINGGFKQPKCVNPSVELKTPEFANIFDLIKPVTQIFVKLVLCPHQSAVDIFTESISRRGCIFWGQAIKMNNMIASSHLSADGDAWQAVYYKAGVDTDCTPESCSPLGLDTYFWPARGTFVVITRSTDPYCIYKSHVKTIADTLNAVPKSLMVMQHNKEFFPHVTDLKNRISVIPFIYVVKYLLSIDFTGVILVMVDFFVRNLFEIFNLHLSWGSFPLQTLIYFAHQLYTKLASGRSNKFHSKLLMDHLRRIEKQNQQGITEEKMG